MAQVLDRFVEHEGGARGERATVGPSTPEACRSSRHPGFHQCPMKDRTPAAHPMESFSVR